MLLAELHQLRQTRHCSVVVQNFAEHARRLQSGHARKIDSRFGVTGAAQNSAIFRAQRKNVARLHQIVRVTVPHWRSPRFDGSRDRTR